MVRYLGKPDQIWAKLFCIPKNMHSRTFVSSNLVPPLPWGVNRGSKKYT